MFLYHSGLKSIKRPKKNDPFWLQAANRGLREPLCRALEGLFNEESRRAKLLVLTKETNICRPTRHLRLRPTKGRKPLYRINIKLVQLPKHLTDGGPQDVWSEWILRSDLSHPSAPWPWTARWIFIALLEEFFYFHCWPVKRRRISLDRKLWAF